MQNKLLNRNADIQIGTLTVSVRGARDLLKPKKSPETIFYCIVSVDNAKVSTTHVEGLNPRWDVVEDIELYRREVKAKIEVYCGDLDRSVLVGVGSISVNSKSSEALDRWVPIQLKRKQTGEVHLRFESELFGANSFLATIATQASKNEEQDDEGFTKAQMIRIAPGLLRDTKYAVNRLIYALEPLLILRKNVMGLLLWHSKPASTVTMLMLLYISYAGMFLSATCIAMGLWVVLLWVHSIRTGNSNTYVRAADYTTREELFEAAARIKDANRLGARTTLITDIRKVLVRLERMADFIERLRVQENDSDMLFRSACALFLLGAFAYFFPILSLLLVVMRIVACMLVLYMFTLWPMYEQFPEFRENYGVKVLVRKLIQTLKGSATRARQKMRQRGLRDRFKGNVFAKTIRQLTHPRFGVEVSTRKRNLVRVQNAFIGSECVDWLQHYLGVSQRDEALELAKAIYESGCIHEHPQGFLDDSLLYTFDFERIREYTANIEAEKSGVAARIQCTTAREQCSPKPGAPIVQLAHTQTVGQALSQMARYRLIRAPVIDDTRVVNAKSARATGNVARLLKAHAEHFRGVYTIHEAVRVLHSIHQDGRAHDMDSVLRDFKTRRIAADVSAARQLDAAVAFLDDTLSDVITKLASGVHSVALLDESGEGRSIKVCSFVSINDVLRYMAENMDALTDAEASMSCDKLFDEAATPSCVSLDTTVLSALASARSANDAVAVIDANGSILHSLSCSILRGRNAADLTRVGSLTIEAYLAADSTDKSKLKAHVVPETATFADVLRRLAQSGAEHVWVLDGIGRPRGTVSGLEVMNALELMENSTVMTSVREAMGISTEAAAVDSATGMVPLHVSQRTGSVTSALAAIRRTSNSPYQRASASSFRIRKLSASLLSPRSSSSSPKTPAAVSPLSPRAEGNTDHLFQLTSLSSPTWCSVCNRFIWGLARQAFSCRYCTATAHSYCIEQCHSACDQSAMGKSKKARLLDHLHLNRNREQMSTSVEKCAENNAPGLQLAHNYLQKLPTNVYELAHLRRLDVTHNSLTRIEDAIARLSLLEELLASFNTISVLSPAIGTLQSMRLLLLNGNRLDRIPSSLGRLTNLRRLDLSDNNLSRVPSEFGNLVQLQELNLADNEIESIPEAIGKCAQLLALNLSRNRLLLLPDSVCGLEKLEHLFVEENMLTALPDGLGRLSALRCLYCSHNQLVALPRTLGALADTLFIQCYDNKFPADLAHAYTIGRHRGLLRFLRVEQSGVDDLELQRALLSPRGTVAQGFTNSISSDSHAGSGTDTLLSSKGTLFVKVISGQNLAAKDKNGTSDPYVYMRCAGSKYRSKPQFKTLSPTWPDAEHCFSVESSRDDVDIQVWDHDKLSTHDPMGHVLIRLRELPDGKQMEDWYRLVPQKKEDVSGSILVRLYYVSEEHRKARLLSTENRRLSRTTSVKLQNALHLGVISKDQKSSKKLKNSKKARKAAVADSVAKGTLSVRIVSGADLAPKDSNGFSDPYYKLRVGHTQVKGARRNKTLNPTWNEETHDFVITDDVREVRIDLFDHDKFGRDDPMGMVLLSMQMIMDSATVDVWRTQTLPVVPQTKEKVSGSLTLTYRYTPFSNPLSSMDEEHSDSELTVSEGMDTDEVDADESSSEAETNTESGDDRRRRGSSVTASSALALAQLAGGAPGSALHKSKIKSPRTASGSGKKRTKKASMMSSPRADSDSVESNSISSPRRRRNLHRTSRK